MEMKRVSGARMKARGKIILTVAAAALLLGALAWLYVWGNAAEVGHSGDFNVIFVPGVWTEDNVPEMYEERIAEVFPYAQISVRQWPSNRISWERIKLEADLLAGKLAKEIYAMTDDERDNLVLVGHSMGAMVVMRAMEDLHGYGMCIRRGVFLGAAMPDDDEGIAKAILASRMPCINICNRKDNVLSVVYSSVVADYEKFALGAYGSRVRFPETSLVEVHMKVEDAASKEDESFWDILRKKIDKNMENYQRHYAELYFNELKKILGDEARADAICPKIILRRFSSRFNLWKTISEKDGWELRRHALSRDRCIANPAGVIVAAGDASEIDSRYKSLLIQLDDAERFNDLEVAVPQDETITVEKILPLDGLWDTVDECDGWLLQRNTIAATYRIVDSRDCLRASGSKEKMKEAFQKVREQLTGAILM